MKRLHIPALAAILAAAAMLLTGCNPDDDSKKDGGNTDPVNTGNAKVEITTGDATDIKKKSAIMTATCAITDADGLGGIACFYYNSTAGNAEAVRQNGIRVFADSVTESSKTFSAAVSGLDPDTRYYYVACITLDGHEYTGTVKSFTTLASDEGPMVFYQKDGIVRYIAHSALDDIQEVDNGNIVKYCFSDSRVASYSKNMLDSVTYSYPSGISFSAFPDASDFRSAIDNAETPQPRSVTEPPAPDEDADDYSDYIENFSVKNSIVFTWAGNDVTWSGTVPSGVTITKDQGHVTVQSTKGKMKYRLQGTTSDGSFKVADMNVTETDDNNKKFILELYGVDITNPNGPAINIQSGKTILVNMPLDKVNNLKDGAVYTQTDGESQKGTFFSEGQLVFSGPGTLNVTSLGGHGICSDDYIRLRYNAGNINITSIKDGFNTKDRFLMYGGNITVKSSGDGVTVRRGPFELYGGSLDISCSDDGIVSDYSLEADVACVKIGGGNLNIATTDAKGHSVTTTGNLTIENGTVTASTQGAASKCLTASGEMVIKDSYINLTTQGDPLFDEDENDWSSAACIRAKSSLSISGSDVYLFSAGNGSKCINAASDVTLGSSALSLVTNGDDYDGDGNKIRSRAIDVISMSVNDGTSLGISAAKTAVYVETGLNVTGGNTFAYSLSDETKALYVKGTITQTGGLVMSGLSK